MTRPTIRPHLRNEKRTPRSLFSQPSITIFNTPSRSLPRAVRAAITAMSIKANETILRTCSDPSIYCESQLLAAVENWNERKTPASMATMAITWAMNPFLSPCMRAGMKHKRIMMSSIFICLSKNVYICRLKKSAEGFSECKNR